MHYAIYMRLLYLFIRRTGVGCICVCVWCIYISFSSSSFSSPSPLHGSHTKLECGKVYEINFVCWIMTWRIMFATFDVASCASCILCNVQCTLHLLSLSQSPFGSLLSGFQSAFILSVVLSLVHTETDTHAHRTHSTSSACRCFVIKFACVAVLKRKKEFTFLSVNGNHQANASSTRSA